MKLRDIKNGDQVVCGGAGVRVYPTIKSRAASDFVFMANEVSSAAAGQRLRLHLLQAE